ncbi:TetR/AcrR family transcriptional regulator [Dermatobacter hominis]|uniref:TetR/AcrR family transcriptional regulator n=1 Tax=Dermatobacter hominis TaxID=2884263 RepID=UPI001D12F3C6|nr:TetR/AcrR family transcriptional regulator [Dermatobacter hominis]UDY34276.1 TetR/AcrR family transcriptional regulator [Dermatobacter hominis]
MGRPTAAERRRAYLQVGADMVTLHGPAATDDGTLDALANVKVADVARRAGVTKGALYHIWDSQEDYRRDLFQHLLDIGERANVEQAEQLLADAVDDDGEPITDTTELATRLASAAYREMRDDPKMLARFSFYNYAHDPRVNEMLAEGVAAFDVYYERYLAAAGRRMRAPFELRHLITSVNSYLFGTIIRHRITGGTDTTIDEAELYAEGFRAILLHLTEPDPDAEAAAATA